MEESSHNNKFCGSLKYIRGQMINKDYITIFISVSAFGLSLFSLIVTLVQKNKETKRTIRKNLSDTIENISKIGIETAKLQANKEASADVLEPIKKMKKIGEFGKWLNNASNPFRKQHFSKKYTNEAIEAFINSL